ncbi:MAG: hypothetical protein ACLQDL_12960 [Spirochaetia bacterium]
MTLRVLRAVRPLPCVLLPALLLAAGTLWGLDAADGRVRLSLIEGAGRFSIACQTGGAGGVFVPLFSSQDPRTSFLSIVVGNKVYRMGESSDFSESAEKAAGGARFVWKSSFLQVTETFTFVPSLDSPVSTGVRIDLSMRNLSERDIAAGARYLFDTYLGEPSSVHFRTPTLTQMTHELTLTPADKTAWWLSPLAGDPNDFGLQVMLTGAGVTVPDRVVFANWKRLSDASWAYKTSSAVDFSLLPYSQNDSAVAQYYEPRTIPRAGETTITLVLGLYSKAGYGAGVPAASPPNTDFAAGVQQSLAAAQNAGSNAQAARADLSAVNAILSEIDAKIGTPGAISDDELALIESTLKELGSRAGRYAPAAGK